ncbi:thioredoxin family protein [Dethiothermospora halolimnae]|uniref:thioredoxin family protein n=1 Tax=Dethiothermospora halolimnae TaxID=3114390 RepID=UPI003CCC0E51
MIKDICLDSLDEDIFNKDKLVLLMFYAHWYKPSMETLSCLKQIDVKDIDIYKVDYNKYRDLSKGFEVVSIPTIVFLKKGRELSRYSGTQTIKQLNIIIDKIKEVPI